MFMLAAEHIKGVDNVVADALSCNNLALARCMLQDVAELPDSVPDSLVEILLMPMQGWSEQQWDLLRTFTSTKG